MQANYLIYPTLLDGFTYFLKSESDNAYQEFINRLNRVPFISEAANKGTAFNEVVDFLIPNNFINQSEKVYYKGFDFKNSIVSEFTSRLKGATPQFKCTGYLETSKGVVELYGYVDEILKDKVVDIKTTGNYTFPHYLSNFQHIVYPYCLNQEGIMINHFTYMITDFNNYYEEDYIYDESKDLPRLIEHVELLIEFMENNKHMITDKKLFNQHFVIQ